MKARLPVLAVLVLLAARPATAQISLVVDGRDILGVTSTLVPGSSYAPGGELAAAVGADMYVDLGAERVTLSMGGRFLALPVVSTGTAAGMQGTLDGAPIATGAAVQSGVEIFLPVKGVVEAFGGTVAYLQSENQVVGVLPRGEVTGATLDRVGDVERLHVQVSAPVPYSSFANDTLASIQLRLARADLVRARTLEGETMVRADLIPGRGVVDLRIQLAPGAEATTTTLPNGRGFVLVVEARPADGETPQAEALPQIVVDPGHGGEDDGLAFGDGSLEDALAWAFAERLGQALRQRRVDVRLTRQGDEPVSVEGRSAAGVGADLFVSVHAADLPAGQFRAYFLGEADTTAELDFAIRENAADEAAEEATDGVRRRILLELVPDLATGRRYAAALGNQLFQLGGYRSAETRAAPLAVLTGAAGRGLLLEFAPVDLE